MGRWVFIGPQHEGIRMTEVTRRAFIGQTGAAAVAASAMAGEHSETDVVFDRLQKLVGRSLRLTRDGRTWVTCRVTKVEHVGPSPFRGARKPFSVLLTAPADTALQQDVYMIHDGLTEQFKHLVVPVDQTESGLILEMVFN